MIKDLLLLNDYDYNKYELEAAKAVEEWTKGVESFEAGLLSITNEIIAVESAIGGNKALNMTTGFIAKLGNIFTARQSGFNSNVAKMQKIDPVGIKRESSSIGLNVEAAQEYLRISQAFNLNVSEHAKAKWMELARDLEAEIDAQNDVAYDAIKLAVKLCIIKYIMAATIILFPIAFFLHIAQYYYIGFALGTKIAAKHSAGVEIVIRKGQELMSSIMSTFVYDTYIAIDPKNKAGVKLQNGVLSLRDADIAINHIISELQSLKTDLSKTKIVSYDEKIKAAEIVRQASDSIYKGATHTLTPGNMGFMKTMVTKLSTRGRMTPEMQDASRVYTKLGAAADMYFDITNMIVSNLYKM